MRRLCCVLAVATACVSGGPTDPDSTTDAGTDGGTSNTGAQWSAPSTIDGDWNAGLDLIAAVDPSGHAAAAYFTKMAPARYTLKLARDNGSGTWTTETVQADLTGRFGIGLSFDPQGNPAVAFLGGGSADAEGDGRWHSLETGEPLPSDAVVMRKSGASWSTTTLATLSGSVVNTGFGVDDIGVVTGLWPAIGFDASGALHSVFRDVHFGVDATATEDSNLEYVRGGSSSGALVAGGRGDAMQLSGAGTYSRMVIAEGQPAVSFALSPEATEGAQEVWFSQRGNDGSWTKMKVSDAAGKLGHPPSLAHGNDFAIAYYDAGQNDLVVARSNDGKSWMPSTWEALGETGLFPAAAFDSESQLGVLYALCRRPTDAQGKCSDAKELRFRLDAGDSERVAGVMPEATALVFDASNRFVAIYRDTTGVHVATRGQ